MLKRKKQSKKKDFEFYAGILGGILITVNSGDKLEYIEVENAEEVKKILITANVIGKYKSVYKKLVDYYIQMVKDGIAYKGWDQYALAVLSISFVKFGDDYKNKRKFLLDILKQLKEIEYV